MVQSLDLLKEYGFVKVGSWNLDSRIKSGVNYQLKSMRKKRVIYSFVVDSNPQYLGCCEAANTTLDNRMGRYRSMQGTGTNKRVLKKIKKSLQNNEEVHIYAWNPPLQLKYKKLKWDFVMGLEGALIKRFKPAWNKR
jgi:hypothetical protein